MTASLLSRLAIQDLIPRANRLVCQNAIKHSLHLCNLPIGVDELDQETEYLDIVNALVLRIEKLRYPISSAPNLVIIYMVWYRTSDAIGPYRVWSGLVSDKIRSNWILQRLDQTRPDPILIHWYKIR